MRIPRSSLVACLFCVAGCVGDVSYRDEIISDADTDTDADADASADADANADADGGADHDGVDSDPGTDEDHGPPPGACTEVSSTAWELVTPSMTAPHPGEAPATQEPIFDQDYSEVVYMNVHSGGNGNYGESDGLYKSEDCAATWTRISTGRNSDIVKRGSWQNLIINEDNPDIMLTTSIYGAQGVWKSSTGGVDWDQKIPSDVSEHVVDNFFNALSVDPEHPNHVIASVHAGGCRGDFAPNCLAETTDGGEDWTLIKGPASGGIFDGVTLSMLNSDTWYFVVPFSGLWRTEDRGATWENAFDDEDIWGQMHRAPNGHYFFPTGHGVIKSVDGMTWENFNMNHITFALAASDTYLYGADVNSRFYWRAPLSNLANYEVFSTTGMPNDNRGAANLRYDLEHGILYSSNWSGGLWRIAAP